MMSDSRVDISIVIPVYNAREWISDCVHSALSAYSGPLEVVCVDDGSTDGSGEILDSIAERHPGLIVIHQDNHGRCHARNVGIRAAHGEWIGFLDADDSMIALSLDCVMTVPHESVDLINFSSQWSDRTADSFLECVSVDCRQDSPSPAYVVLEYPDALRALSEPRCFLDESDYLSDDVRAILGQIDPLWCWTIFTKLFRASALKESGVVFEKSLKFSEDVIFAYDFLVKTQASVLITPVMTHIYNVGNDGTTRTYALGDLQALMNSFRAFDERFEASPYPEEIEWRCISDFLFVSERALEYKDPRCARSEIKGVFDEEVLGRYAKLMSAKRLKYLGTFEPFVWYLAFLALKVHWLTGYIVSLYCMVSLQKLVTWLKRMGLRVNYN